MHQALNINLKSEWFNYMYELDKKCGHMRESYTEECNDEVVMKFAKRERGHRVRVEL